MFLSVSIKRTHPPLPEAPQNITPKEAALLVKDDVYHYVSISAGVDTEQKIYNTVLRRPLYTSRDTSKQYDITEAITLHHEELPSYLGCITTAQIPSLQNLVSLRTVSTRTGKKDEVLSERLLVPLQGTQNNIWVLSEIFKKGDSSQGGWLDRQSYTGVLTYMKDINKNVPYPALDQDWDKIRDFIGKESSIAVNDDTLLIITDFDKDFQPYTIMPVNDTQNSIFAVVHKGEEQKVSNTVTGIFRAWDLEMYKEFPAVLGKELPARIGVIDLMTAQEYNEKHAQSAHNVMLTGEILMGISLLFHIIHFFKRKKLAKK